MPSYTIKELCKATLFLILASWSGIALSEEIDHFDLARGQTAIQSSVDYGGVPGRAVDGNRKGSIYNNGSVTHTKSENQPWWQVDLAHTYQLSKIQIWNRADCCAERLANFLVFVSNTDMSDQSMEALLADTKVWKFRQVNALIANGNIVIPTTFKGRFVRVQKIERGILSLAEVKVYGANLARGKKATQSSTYQNIAVASRAVDGNIDGDYKNGSVSSTNPENQPWWQVDLGVKTAIGKMKLYNRRDAASREFSHFYVFVSDTDMTGKSLDQLVNDNKVWKSFEVVAFGIRYVVAGHSTGRYVRIQRKTSGPLQIAEVAVYGVAANQVLAASKPNPALYGEWSESYDWPHIAVHASLLPNGKILSYDATPDDFGPILDPVNSPNITTRASVWDPVTKSHIDAANDTGDDLFCSGSAQMADGNVFMAGGTTNYNAAIDSTNIYDSVNNRWKAGPKMQFRRWYPAVSNLGTGELILAGGRGGLAEIYNPEKNSLRTLDGIASGVTNGSWPFIMQAPNGLLVFAGGSRRTTLSLIDAKDKGKLIPTNSKVVDRNAGSFVVFDDGQMLVTGGQGGPASADIIEMNTAKVRATNPMNLPRGHHNSIALPDGDVMLIGGSLDGAGCNDEYAAYASELWNSSTEQWRLIAAQKHPRQYHSTAVLLPDARVWSGGHGYATAPSTQIGACSYQNNAEIYSPPYLFKSDGTAAKRPVISVAPGSIAHNDEFIIKTADATQIKSINLIRLSSATHGANFSQRSVSINFDSIGGDQLKLESPVDANLAPSGYYMLFIVNNNGTPSVAKMVKVGTEKVVQPTDNTPTDLVIESLEFSPQVTNGSARFKVGVKGSGDYTYSWDFGDNTPSTGFNSNSGTINHTYAKPGRYIVKVTIRNAQGTEISRSFTQLVYKPLTNGQPKISANLVENADLNQLWSVNPDNNTVSVMNTLSNKIVKEITVGKKPRSIAISPLGNIWVVNKDSASVNVINPNNFSVSKTIKLPVASQPHGLVFDNAAAYIALESTGHIIKLRVSDGKQLLKKSVGSNPRHLSITADTKKLYVSRFITPKLPNENTRTPITQQGNRFYGGEVIVMNTANLDLSTTVILRHSNAPSSDISGPGIPNYLGPAVISPDGSFAWVPSKQDNILAGDFRKGVSLTFDHTVRSISSKINLTSNTEEFSSRIDHDNASIASHSVFSRLGLYLFTALEGNRQVAVSDATSANELFRFDVERAPQGLTVSKNGTRLYVHNFMSRSISVFDIADLTSGKTLAVKKIATVATVKSEKLNQSVLKGKQHFYDSRDDRLAASDYMSCAACHNEGGQDGRVWDLTQFGEGLRNSISLKGRGGLGHGLLHWSGNFDEIQDFESQIRRFAGGSGLMKDSDLSVNDRADPLGESKAGFSADLDALAAYVTSLNVSTPSPYREANGTLTASAKAGEKVYQRESCATCHAGESFTDISGNSSNIGTLKSSSGKRLDTTLTGIDAPTLRGLWLTAPYLHDGSAATIAAAITAHNNISVSTAETNQLADYLNQQDQLSVSSSSIFSNEVPSGKIVVDGQLSDWKGINAYSTDPDDITGDKNPIDIQNISIAHDTQNLHFLYRNHNNVSPDTSSGEYLSWGWQVFIDSDNNSATGYAMGAIGADYILEGGSIQRYQGNGLDWNWVLVGNATTAFDKNIAEVSLARNLIGNPTSFRYLFMGANQSYGGTALDLYPDSFDQAKSNKKYFSYSLSGEVSEESQNAPTALSQNVRVSKNGSISITLRGDDPENDPLTYTLVSNPANGTLTGSGKTFTYKTNTGFIGSDNFAFIVSDGSETSKQATVNITVSEPGTGLISNSVLTVSVDGNDNEWSNVTRFADDPDDIKDIPNLIDNANIETGNIIDYQNIAFAHNSEKLYFLVNNRNVVSSQSGNYIPWGWQTYIDTDSNASTGYRIGDIGAEYILEGNQLHRYTGNGVDFTLATPVAIETWHKNKTIEASFDRSLIGNPNKIRVIFTGNNEAYDGLDTDLYPDNATSSGAANNYFEYSFTKSIQTSNRPAAQSRDLVTVMNTPVNINLTDALHTSAMDYQVIIQPNNGVISGSGANRVYQPNSGYIGDDSFKYIVQGSNSESSIATISLRVNKSTDTGSTDTESTDTSNGSGGGSLPLPLIVLLFLFVSLRQKLLAQRIL